MNYINIRFFISIFFLSSFFSLKGQSFEPLSFQGITNGKILINPFSGGLNSPQFNSIDFNNDGEEDLLVFDRAGNVVLPFIWEDGDWKYMPQYEKAFPVLKEWVILRDYNNDGIQDLFAYSDVPGIDGIMVYKGGYQEDTIAFERVNLEEAFNVLFFELPGGGKTNLRVTKIDYPAIDDIDCDGDLDILTFNVGGGQIELFQNLSVEQGYEQDTLIFKLVDFCWGGLFETGFTKEVELAAGPGECATLSNPNIEFRHAGSTILTIDMDNDGDKEAIVGDLSFDNLNFLQNSGDCSDAWINNQDIEFPSNSVPVNIFSFPAAFWLDVDRDNLKDLIAAPSLARGGEDHKVGWLYKNTSSNETPIFEYQQNRFLVEDMIDLGNQTHPAFVDVDNDGLLDLIVGNGGFFDDFNLSRSGLFYFRNTGSAIEPSFELIDSNYLNMNQFNPSAFNFAPTFGDLDGDEDLDIIVGEEMGNLFFAENTAGPDAPLAFGPWQFRYQNINVGLSSTPQLFDLNDDGLLDLVVGEKDGNVNYFQNIGSLKEANFNADPTQKPNTFFLGQVDARRPGFIIGASHPFFFEHGTERLMISGTENSMLEVYEDVKGKTEEAFSLSSISSKIPNVGFKSAPALADINGDGQLEMVLGNERGGLSFFSTPWIKNQATSTEEPFRLHEFTVFPNPASQYLFIERSEKMDMDKWTISISNMTGQVLMQMQSRDHRMSVDVSSLSSGVYVIHIRNQRKVGSRKLIIQTRF